MLIFRNLLFLLALTFIVSCSKKTDEVTPASLTGKWKHNGVTGKLTATANGKTASQDLAQPANNSIIEFKADGTANFFNSDVKYTVAGSILTIIIGTSTLEYTVKVSGSNLTLSLTKEQYQKLVELAYKKTDKSYTDWITLKPSITEFIFDTNYIKQ